MHPALIERVRERYSPASVYALWRAALSETESERFTREVALRWEEAAEALIAALSGLAARGRMPPGPEAPRPAERDAGRAPLEGAGSRKAAVAPAPDPRSEPLQDGAAGAPAERVSGRQGRGRARAEAAEARRGAAPGAKSPLRSIQARRPGRVVPGEGESRPPAPGEGAGSFPESIAPFEPAREAVAETPRQHLPRPAGATGAPRGALAEGVAAGEGLRPPPANEEDPMQGAASPARLAPGEPESPHWSAAPIGPLFFLPAGYPVRGPATSPAAPVDSGGEPPPLVLPAEVEPLPAALLEALLAERFEREKALKEWEETGF